MDQQATKPNTHTNKSNALPKRGKQKEGGGNVKARKLSKTGEGEVERVDYRRGLIRTT